MSGRHARPPLYRRLRPPALSLPLSALPFRRSRRVPLVLQQTLTDCAPACLAMILAAHGRPANLDELRDELGSGRDGVTAATLREVAVHRGLKYRALRVDQSDLPRLPVPFVAHWDDDHFVVVSRAAPRGFSVADPAIGRRRFSADDFARHYSGVVQLFAPADDPATDLSSPVREAPWRTVLRRALTGQRRTVGLLATVAALLLTAGIAAPVLTGVVVSWIAGATPGTGAGWVLAAAGTGLAVTVAGLGLLRGLLAGSVQIAVGRNLTGSLVDRLLAAPLLFFEHRGRGDVISRVSATETVRDAVAGNLVAAVLDAVTAVGYLGIVLLIDVRVGLVTAGLALVQVTVLGLLAASMQRTRREELLAEAHTHSGLLEAVGGIAWLKAAGAERTAGDAWARRHEEQLGALRRTARLGAVADAAAAAFRTVGPLLVLVVAGLSLVDGRGTAGLADDAETLGRVIGVAALATAALLPFSSLAGHLRALLELASVATHLGDLLTAPAEPSGSARPDLTGSVTLRGVSFRHTRRAAWTVRDVDLDIPAGSKVAIVGPSGSGKSTLAKLIVGLYRPTEGSVELDGTPLSELDVAAVRRQIGVVLQEPFLVTGSLKDNIALRRPDAPFQEIVDAAVAAGVHDDIERMPAGYQTLVTEGGVGLSGGQRQRVAIARALVGRPRLLVLDEATSHVDQVVEQRIDRNLRVLGVTQVVVAHRLSTVRDADLIVVVQDGRIVEQGTHDDLLTRSGAYARLVGGANDPAPGVSRSPRALAVAA